MNKRISGPRAWQVAVAMYFCAAGISQGPAALAQAPSLPEGAGGGEMNLSREERIQKATQYYEVGEQYLQEGKYAEADESLKKAQALLGGISPAVIMGQTRQQPSPQKETQERDTWPARKAWRLSMQGKSQEAIASYAQAIEEEPKNADLYYNLGIEFLRTSQFHKALLAFQEAAKHKPLDKDAFYNMAVLFENYLDDKKKAVEFYRKYLKLAPKAHDSFMVKEWIEEIRKTYGVQ